MKRARDALAIQIGARVSPYTIAGVMSISPRTFEKNRRRHGVQGSVPSRNAATTLGVKNEVSAGENTAATDTKMKVSRRVSRLKRSRPESHLTITAPTNAVEQLLR